jgi:hypothetical protein
VLLIAFAFGLLAMFWALATVIPQWQAALAVAGAALVTAVILRFFGLRLIHRRWPLSQLFGPGQPVAAPQPVVPSPDGLGLANPVMVILTAAVIGLVIGRRVSK